MSSTAYESVRTSCSPPAPCSRRLYRLQAPATEESALRTALREFRSAMNWLEDTPMFEAAHRELDAAGSYVRTQFGCELTYEDGTYTQQCPVPLAHTRIGVSPKMLIGEVRCSVCNHIFEQCEHISGELYDGQLCVREIRRIDRIEEISFVRRPGQPDARIEGHNISITELREVLGKGFEPGMPVSCDICLKGCPGGSDPLARSS